MLDVRRSTPDLVVGDHAAVAVAREWRPGERWLVIHDAAVTAFADEVQRGAGLEPVDRVAVAGARTSRVDDVVATARRIATAEVTAVLALGGGSTLDHAKLACAIAASPSIVGDLRAGARRCGFVPLPSGHRRATRLAAIPTTIGTGSEVSQVACIDAPCGRTLVGGAVLQPAMAALDPRATTTLPRWIYVEGVLEVLLRVVGPRVGATSRHALADASARGLLTLLVDQLDEGCPADATSRLTVACASHETHAGWLLRGRSGFPSPLWYVANELAVLTGARKVPASLALLGPWLARARREGGRWGSPDAAATVLALLGIDDERDVSAAVRARIEAWAPDSTSLSRVDADEVARRSAERWGGRAPMLARFSHRDLATWVEEALLAGSATADAA